MKKLMFAALMLLGTSAAFAGDSDALKAILKAKTYDECSALVKSSLGSLASNAEKAKAYNKLVDLAMQKVSKEQSTINSNQMATQFKQGKVEPYDTVGFYTACRNALEAGLECDKYDQMPNEKGKVSPKFHKANQDRLYGLRLNLINAGQEAGNKNDKDGALANYGMYVESATAPLFKEVDKTKNPDQYLGEVARVAAVYAFQNGKMELADKYVDVAMQDTATYKDALNLKLYLASQQLKSHEDSLNYVNKIADIYAKNKTVEVFSQYASMLSALKLSDKFYALCDQRLAEVPGDYTATALKGQQEMNEGKMDAAIADFKKAVEAKKDEPIVYTYLGFCINSKAAQIQDPAAQKKAFQEGIPYLEKAKELDPKREKANWSYPLYQSYYVVYGANDPRTKELESMNK